MVCRDYDLAALRCVRNGKYSITPIVSSCRIRNYLAGDCMELTLELSQHKWPVPQLLPQLFEDNLPAMLAYPLAGAFARGVVSCCPAPVHHQLVSALPDSYRRILQAFELFPMHAHIVAAVMYECRGFVRELPAQTRHLREAASSGGDGEALRSPGGCHGHQPHHRSVCGVWRLLQACITGMHMMRRMCA